MIEEISVDRAKELMKNTENTFIDVRSQQEWDEVHLDSAIHVPDEEAFKEKILPLDKEKVYVLFCSSGSRSGYVMQIMKEQGFKNLLNVMGYIFN